MTFTVIWHLSASQEVTRIEQAADDPAAVRAAATRIDWALRRTPRGMGESRDPRYRLWYEDVLGVYYKIDEAAMRVDEIYAGPAPAADISYNLPQTSSREMPCPINSVLHSSAAG